MSIENLVKLSIADLAAAYAAGSLSPVEVLKTTIAHAEAINPAINALFSFRPEQASVGTDLVEDVVTPEVTLS
jgi:Asp-tRNA(Asn)/Glu-tRNA(Gln) amidotransferase A subunit family amidase